MSTCCMPSDDDVEEAEGINDEEFLFANDNAAEEESRHFSNVCYSMHHYIDDALKEVARCERHFRSLSVDDLPLLCESPESRIDKMKKAVETNQNFLRLVLSAQSDKDIDEAELAGLPPTQTADNSEAAVDRPILQESSNADKHVESSRESKVAEASPEDTSTAFHLTAFTAKNKTAQNGSSSRHGCLHQNHNSEQACHGHPGANSTTTESNCCPEASEYRQGPPLSMIPDGLHAQVPPPSILSRNVARVRSTLRQFVRDWSKEGEWERNAAYGPLMEAMEKYLPLEEGIRTRGRPPRILCPGSGLGRLPFEIVKRGYGCQGNEFSYFMLLGSQFVLNCNMPPESCAIQPFCLSTSNRKSHDDHLRVVRVPDLCPGDFVAPGIDFSMCAGEFVEVYYNQKGVWDGVLTCFFLDTAKNIILYIRTIANILREGGLWSNFGPLLYHYAETPYEMSIELSWEEVLPIIEKYFTVVNHEWRDSYYTTNHLAMMQVQYHCIFFSAIRNDVAVEGQSNPVF